jgi:lipopolysaccharide transport system permease protein
MLGVPGFILTSVKRDFVSRYLGTQFGFFWAVVHPLALIVIYTVIFSQIMKPALSGHDSKFAYSIYLCAGILIWQLFSDLVGRSVGVFVRNADLLKKVNLPKLALPVVVVLSALSNFAVIAVLFAGFLLLIGAFPASAIFAIIPVLFFWWHSRWGWRPAGHDKRSYRDVERSTTMLLQFWFWLTPIVYPGRVLPECSRPYFWNPMWPIVTLRRLFFWKTRYPSGPCWPIPPSWRSFS